MRNKDLTCKEKGDGILESAKILFKTGKLTVEDAVALLHISKEEVLSWKR